jgi:AraC-like DNA-binding protein
MSFELGFADPSNFYRACKRWFGHSPKELRQLN